MLHNKNVDKGFSLIEIIVTIAIMSIVTAASFGIYTYIGSSTLKQARSNITDSMAYARTEKQAKSGDWYVEIYKDSDGKYVSAVYNDANLVRDAKNDRQITGIDVRQKGTSTMTALGSGEKIYMKYKSNGSFETACVTDSGGAELYKIDAIRVENAGRTATIKLAWETGKFFLD